MFTTEHFLWIGICIAMIVGLEALAIRLRFSFHTAACVMAWISLVSEVSKIISDMEPVRPTDASKGMVLDAGSLPLHLCSLLIFAFFYLPFAKEGKFKQFILSLTVPVGLIGSVLAILMATSGTAFDDIDAYQCFIYHAGMTWFAIYLMRTGQAELGRKAWMRNISFLFAMAILMIWVNSILQVYETNFWYVVRPPVEDLPILNLDHGWFAYFGSLLVLGFLGVSAVHLPFMTKEVRQKE